MELHNTLGTQEEQNIQNWPFDLFYHLSTTRQDISRSHMIKGRGQNWIVNIGREP